MNICLELFTAESKLLIWVHTSNCQLFNDKHKINNLFLFVNVSVDTFSCSMYRITSYQHENSLYVVYIIGVLGNVTVIIHTTFSTKEKTATSYLVGNLALADLLMCLTLYPVWIVEFIQIMLDSNNDQDLFCKLSRSTTWAFMFASVATLLAITVDRYLFIVKPLRYAHIVTHRLVFLAVSGIWITAC